MVKIEKKQTINKEESVVKYIFSVFIESLTIGIAVLGSIIAGAVIGWLIDEKLFKGKYFPWITTVFILFGAIGGIKNLIYYSQKRIKEEEKRKTNGKGRKFF